MEFIKNLLGRDKSIIGLSGLRKREVYVKISIPENYKKAYVPRVEQYNYLLF